VHSKLNPAEWRGFLGEMEPLEVIEHRNVKGRCGRMGFEIAHHGESTTLRVFIEYELPEARPPAGLAILWRRLYDGV
jgi:uncharacterized membrane protein